MAPRQDRTPLIPGVSSRMLRGTGSLPGFNLSTLGTTTLHGGNFEGGINIKAYDGGYSIRSGELYSNAECKKKNICNGSKRKTCSNLAQAIREHSESLQERDEIIALGQEAMMYKLRRQEIQAQARELRRILHKKTQEIRRKRREIKCLRAKERELIEFLKKCESQPQEETQLVVQSTSPLAFKANLYRVYVLCAALISFLLVRVVSYGSIIVNRV